MTLKDFIYFATVLAVWVLVAYLCAKYIGAWVAVAVIVGGVSWAAWPDSKPPMHIDD